jgi:hypothetical protein
VLISNHKYTKGPGENITQSKPFSVGVIIIYLIGDNVNKGIKIPRAGNAADGTLLSDRNDVIWLHAPGCLWKE